MSQQDKLDDYRKEEQKKKRLEYYKASRERLIKISEKKIKTSFIGAIAAFEKRFGHLWGAGTKWENKNDKEKYYAELWSDVRSEVLGKGNGQIRSFEEELRQHDVSYVGQKIELKQEVNNGKEK